MTMSMPERSHGRTRTGAARLRPLAVAGVAVALTATGCANYEVTKPYQPASGVQTDAPGMKVRNLMVLESGSTGQLAGTLISAADDQLTGVTGTAQKQDGTAGKELTISAPAVTLPANQGVELGQQKSTVSGAAVGSFTTLTLKFAKSGPITIQVPVVSSENMDVSTASPAAAASNAG